MPGCLHSYRVLDEGDKSDCLRGWQIAGHAVPTSSADNGWARQRLLFSLGVILWPDIVYTVTGVSMKCRSFIIKAPV